MIDARGDEMLAAGGAADLVRVVEALPCAVRTPETQLILGDAYRMSGDVAAARRAFAPLLARPGRPGPRLAWRMAMLEYMRGDYRAALECLGEPAPGPPAGPDDILMLVCRSSALAHLGSTDEAADVASLALAAAGAAQVGRHTPRRTPHPGTRSGPARR
jgi:hypothetical protein